MSARTRAGILRLWGVGLGSGEAGAACARSVETVELVGAWLVVSECNHLTLK
jgi:hypothetical protein